MSIATQPPIADSSDERALDTLYRLTDSVAHAESLQEIYDAALDCLQAALNVDRSSILLLDADQVMRFKAWRRLSDRYRAAVEGHSPWQPDESRAQPVVISDVTRDRDLAGFGDLFRDEQIGALAFIPLCYGDKLLGKFMLYYRDAHEFTARESSIARVIAGHVAFSVERMRLLEAEQKARARAEQVAARVTRLQRITAGLSRAITPSRVADIVLDEGVDASEAQASAIFLVNNRGDTLEIVCDRGYPPSVIDPHRRMAIDSAAPAAVAFRSRTPVWIESPEQFEDGYPELARIVGTRRSTAFACVPLAAGDTAVGVMVLGFAEIRRFGSEERAFLCAIAEQGALALERARHYERAQRAAAARDELLRIVAHDLRNPLGAIAMTATTMHERVPDPSPAEWQHCAEIILRNTGQMNRLIRDLLDASRIEADQLTVEFDWHPLRDVLDHAFEAGQVQAGARTLALHVAPEVADIMVRCDRERILQVLGNLVGNAIKYTPDHGRITIRATRRGTEAVVIAIEDTGTGIRVDHLPHIFTRYWQAGDQAQRKQGVGLGLFIAKALVEAHGGRIRVASAPGQGCTFHISLPVDPGGPRDGAAGETTTATAR